MNQYLRVLRTFTFKGRADRAEFWWFVLFNIIASLVLRFASMMLGWVLNVDDLGNATLGRDMNRDSIPLLEAGYQLLTIIQQIALQVRRFHDRRLSGCWLMVGFAILVGATFVARASIPSLGLAVTGVLGLALLVINVLPGEDGTNKYGPDPHAEPGSEFAEKFS